MTPSILPFWRAMIADPRRIGAITPSSRALCDALAEEVLAAPPGHVIELGAGTGAVTRALFQRRAHFDSLSVIERAPRLARRLAAGFPGLTVLPICASQLDGLHPGPLEVVTVVSSLPFRSLPRDERQRIGDALRRLARRTRHFRVIQYSYLGRVPFALAHDDPLQWTRRRTILTNLPPATVWLLAPRP